LGVKKFLIISSLEFGRLPMDFAKFIEELVYFIGLDGDFLKTHAANTKTSRIFAM
jgi:hypothetical protein